MAADLQTAAGAVVRIWKAAELAGGIEWDELGPALEDLQEAYYAEDAVQLAAVRELLTETDWSGVLYDNDV